MEPPWSCASRDSHPSASRPSEAASCSRPVRVPAPVRARVLRAARVLIPMPSSRGPRSRFSSCSRAARRAPLRAASERVHDQRRCGDCRALPRAPRARSPRLGRGAVPPHRRPAGASRLARGASGALLGTRLRTQRSSERCRISAGREPRAREQARGRGVSCPSRCAARDRRPRRGAYRPPRAQARRPPRDRGLGVTRLRVAARLLEIHRALVRHGLDDFVRATHLYRPFRFLFYLSPWTWFQRSAGATRGERLAARARGARTDLREVRPGGLDAPRSAPGRDRR